MKLFLSCLVMLQVQFSFARRVSDITQKVKYGIKIGVNFREQAQEEISAYADSINSHQRGSLPYFLFDPCLDWKKSYWPDMHTATSVRWAILKKVNNKQALKMIIQTHDKILLSINKKTI
jgi:hypothetical protein